MAQSGLHPASLDPVGAKTSARPTYWVSAAIPEPPFWALHASTDRRAPDPLSFLACSSDLGNPTDEASPPASGRHCALSLTKAPVENNGTIVGMICPMLPPDGGRERSPHGAVADGLAAPG